MTDSTDNAQETRPMSEADAMTDVTRYDPTHGSVLWVTYNGDYVAYDDYAALEKRLIDAASSLAAAISLLERGGKKAAASDKMFAQMLIDYNRSLDRARAALKGDKTDG